jgi:hypothetical protein
MAQDWTNSDGLYIRFGTKEAEKTKLGEYGNYDPGSTHMVQLRLDWADYPALSKVLHRSCRLPGANGQTMLITKASVYVEEPFDSAGDALTLTIGLDNQDGTVFDADAIDNAIAQTAIDAVGDEVQCDGSSIEVLLNNTQPLLLTVTPGGAVPTAGKGWVRVWYMLKNP